MTKRLCTAAGCNAVVNHPDDGSSPRCEKHISEYKKRKPESDRKRKYEHHYDEQGRNLYHTSRWRKLRKQKVAMNPCCEHCERFGIATPVNEVDHIVEIEDGGEFWNINNLQSLCFRHHRIKTNQAKAERNQKKDKLGYFI